MLDRRLGLTRSLRMTHRGAWEGGRRAHLAVELGFLDHQEVGNGFQKLGLPQPMPSEVLGQKDHHMRSQFLWPCLCEEQPLTSCWALTSGRIDCQPRQCSSPCPQPLPSMGLPPSSTCQAADQMLPRVPQETGAAQSSFQPLPTMEDRLQRGRWLWREAEPSLLLQGTHQRPI